MIDTLARTTTAGHLAEMGGEAQGARISWTKLAGRVDTALDSGAVLLVAGPGLF
jgi:hypothetical protein